MIIEQNRPDLFPDFIRLNEVWITEHFEIEAMDRHLSEDPGRVLREGGHISLGSNTKLAPAIALYRSLGFTVVREGAHPEYARCNIVMGS